MLQIGNKTAIRPEVKTDTSQWVQIQKDRTAKKITNIFIRLHLESIVGS